MDNPWVSALIKTLITLVVVHVIMLVLGLFFGDSVGWFSIPMIWPHWHRTTSIICALVAAVLLYAGIYCFGTKKSQ